MGSDILLLYTVRFSGWVSSKVLKQNPSQDLLKSIINIISTRYEFSRFAFAHEFWKNFDKIQKIVPQSPYQLSGRSYFGSLWCCLVPLHGVMSHKDVTKVAMTMVSVFRCQVSGRYRGQPATSRSTLSSRPKGSAESKTIGRLNLFPVIWLLPSVIWHLKPDTWNPKQDRVL